MGNMVTEKSLGWVTAIESSGDITATQAEVTVAVAVVVAAVIAEAGGIMDMVSPCSGAS